MSKLTRRNLVAASAAAATLAAPSVARARNIFSSFPQSLAPTVQVGGDLMARRLLSPS